MAGNQGEAMVGKCRGLVLRTVCELEAMAQSKLVDLNTVIFHSYVLVGFPIKNGDFP